MTIKVFTTGRYNPAEVGEVPFSGSEAIFLSRFECRVAVTSEIRVAKALGFIFNGRIERTL